MPMFLNLRIEYARTVQLQLQSIFFLPTAYTCFAFSISFLSSRWSEAEISSVKFSCLDVSTPPWSFYFIFFYSKTCMTVQTYNLFIYCFYFVGNLKCALLGLSFLHEFPKSWQNAILVKCTLFMMEIHKAHSVMGNTITN